MVFNFTLEATVLGYPANRWAVDSSRQRWNKWRLSADGNFVDERISSGQLTFH
jgi:hypothetical protein